jgi:hypothetical protein
MLLKEATRTRGHLVPREIEKAKVERNRGQKGVEMQITVDLNRTCGMKI